MPERSPVANSSILPPLESLLASGVEQLGKVHLWREKNGCLLLHFLDIGRDDLELATELEAALEIAKYDAAGNYRPRPRLKPVACACAPF